MDELISKAKKNRVVQAIDAKTEHRIQMILKMVGFSFLLFFLQEGANITNIY